MKNSYYRYLTNHISAVSEVGEIAFGKRYPSHDLSKWGVEEFLQYENFFYGEHTEKVTEEFDKAWLHHQNTNPHHWQYWVLIRDDGSITPLDIPDEYIQEMVSDWGSFAWNNRTGDALLEWYSTNNKNMILSENTRRKVDELVMHVAKCIDEHFKGESI